jgi:two-component system response regulator YesN
MPNTKVAIIDDEPLVRLGLQSMLRWEDLGYEIVGEAANGRQGLDLIIEHNPDIVITDVKMPVLDGLEMMRLASQAGRHPKYIVLSGYDEFHLVKQAMKLGAEEYLIKLDLESEALEHALAAAREKIIAERGGTLAQKPLHENIGKNIHLFRESFFRQIIAKPGLAESTLLEQAKHLGLKLSGRLTCAAVRINNLSVLDKYEEDEITSFEAVIRSTIDEIVNDVYNGYTFSWSHGEFVVVFAIPEQTDEAAFRDKATALGERLTQVLDQYFGIEVSVGISDPCCRYSDLASAYFNACRAAQQSYYTGDQPVLLFRDLPRDYEDPDQIDVSALRDDLTEALELHDVKMIGKVFESIISLLNKPNVSRKQAYDICFQIAYSISGSPEIGEEKLREIFGDLSLYETILGLGTLAQIINWLIGLEQRICRVVAGDDQPKMNRVVARAKRYILDHYMERITLEQVASSINISPGYLSTIFRQSAGVCFTDYVTRVKINEAKRLLRETDYKVYEVSEMLGYQNAYYFSRVFKKIVGITPTEYSGKAF